MQTNDKVLIKQTKNQNVLTVVQDKSLLRCSAYILNKAVQFNF